MDDIELFGLTYLQQISDCSDWRRPAHRTGDLGAPASHHRAAGAAAVRRRHRFSDGLHSARQRHTGEGDRPEVHRPADVADIQRGLQRLDLSVLQQHAVSRWRARSSRPGPPNSTCRRRRRRAPAHGFTQYTITNPPSAANPRTPFGNVPAVPLPAEINGVLIQDLVNDPITLLQGSRCAAAG